MKSKLLTLAWIAILSIRFLQAQDVRGTKSIGITDISVIEIAPNGDVWVGSLGQGIAFYNAAQQSWNYYNTANTPLLTSDTVYDIKPKVINGVERSYIATAKGVSYSMSGGGWDTLSNLGGGKVWGVNINTDSVWALRGNALVNFDSSNVFRQSFASPFPAISCVQRSNSTCSGFWAGTANNGLFYTSNGVAFTFIDTSAPNKKLVDNRVNALATDNSCSTVFVATKGGFSVCPLTGPSCQNFTTANSTLPQNDITDLVIGCSGQVWLTTRDSGVVVFENQIFTRVTTANGLTDNRTSAIGCNIADCSAYVGTPTGDIAIIDSAKTVQLVLSTVKNISRGGISVSVFPQPAKDKIHFVGKEEWNNAVLTLTDLSGRTVAQVTGNTTNCITLDVSALSAGMYLYRISTHGVTLKSGRVEVMK
jgi:ligand-binding sensor domain-containing protein